MLVARAGELIKWEGGAAIPLEMAGGIQCHTRWLFPVPSAVVTVLSKHTLTFTYKLGSGLVACICYVHCLLLRQGLSL